MICKSRESLPQPRRGEKAAMSSDTTPVHAIDNPNTPIESVNQRAHSGILVCQVPESSAEDLRPMNVLACGLSSPVLDRWIRTMRRSSLMISTTCSDLPAVAGAPVLVTARCSGVDRVRRSTELTLAPFSRRSLTAAGLRNRTARWRGVTPFLSVSLTLAP